MEEPQQSAGRIPSCVRTIVEKGWEMELREGRKRSDWAETASFRIAVIVKPWIVKPWIIGR